jgi:hypothetical protein
LRIGLSGKGCRLIDSGRQKLSIEKTCGSFRTDVPDAWHHQRRLRAMKTDKRHLSPPIRRTRRLKELASSFRSRRIIADARCVMAKSFPHQRVRPSHHATQRVTPWQRPEGEGMKVRFWGTRGLELEL